MGEQHAQFETRRDFAHRAGVAGEGNTHPQQQLAGARLGSVAIEFSEARLQFSRVHIVSFGRVGVGVNGVFFMHHLPHFVVTHHHHIDHALVFIRELILAQPCHAFVRVERDVAAARFKHPGQNFHESGFAAAVGADQAIAVAVAEFDGNVFEQGLSPVMDGDIGSG